MKVWHDFEDEDHDSCNVVAWLVLACAVAVAVLAYLLGAL